MRRLHALAAVLALGAGTAGAQGVVSIDSDAPPAAPPTRRATALAQEVDAALQRASKQGALTLRVRQTTVQARWVGARSAALAQLPPCTLLTPQSISLAMHAVKDAITAPDAALRAMGGAAQFEVTWIDVDFVNQQPGQPGLCDGAPTVEVVLRPLHLRVSTEALGDNLLPLARSALGTAYGEVPAALRALNPSVSLKQDRRRGTTLGLALQAPLATLAAGLEAQADVQHAVNGPHRNAQGALQWRTRLAAAPLVEARLRGSAGSLVEPLGAAEHRAHHETLGAGLSLRFGHVAKAWVDAGWSASGDALRQGGLTLRDAASHQLSTRLLADALLPQSLATLRAGLWHEQSRATLSSSRWAAQFGAAREFRLAPGRLLGVDGVFSLGRASGGSPAERRFQAGAPDTAFLYNSVTSAALLAQPAGPALRSMGTAQAQLGSGANARGARRYWGASLNLAWPVQRWYRPLIPDDVTDLQPDASKPPLSVKELLMKQVDVTGPNMMQAQLQLEGRTPLQARNEALAALAEVRPAVRYLVEDAPLWAVRPMLMIDAAGLADETSRERWLALGLGAQVQVATARFEAGVMRNVKGPSGSQPRSALVLRLTFQNLF